jgi:hypothetical protein
MVTLGMALSVSLPLVLALALPTAGLPPDAAPSGWSQAPNSTLLAAKKKPKPKKPKGKKGKGKEALEAELEAATVQQAPVNPAIAGPANLPAPRPLPTKFLAIALLPISAIDVDGDTIEDFEDALLDEIDETEGMRSISPSDLEDDIDELGLNATLCDGDVTCLGRAARYAGAHFAVETRLAAVGGTFSISMRLIDTEMKTEIARVAEPVSEDEKERATELHRLAVQLLNPESFIGTLVIRCPQPQADVYLDDRLIGQTPIAAPIVGLRAGPHILRISKEGFSDVHQFVDVAFKRSSTIDVDLSTTTISGIIEPETVSGLGALFLLGTEDGVEVRVDGEPKGTLPLAEAISGIPAGKRRLSLRKAGVEPVVQEIEIKSGQRTDLQVQTDGSGFKVELYQVVNAATPLPERDRVAAADPTSGSGPVGAAWRPSWRLPAGLIIGGIGAVGLLSTSYFTYQVDQQNEAVAAMVSDLDEEDGVYQCNDLGQNDCDSKKAAVDDANDRGERLEKMQWIALVAGGALVAIGGGLVLWDLFSPAPEASGTVAPGEAAPAPDVSVEASIAPLPGGAAVFLRADF